MVRAISAYLEFCYLVRRSQIDSATLDQIEGAVARFHQERKIFIQTGVRDDFSLPRQHSLSHYRFLIQQFGAPNGLCSSITESRHITAVKKPWRRSNRNEPLGQMLLTNQRLDKLAASRVDFFTCGMLDGPLLTSGLPIGMGPAHEPHPSPSGPRGGDRVGDAEAVEGITSLGDVKLARYPGESTQLSSGLNDDNAEPIVASQYLGTVDRLAAYLGQPRLAEHIRRFLYDQFHPNSEILYVAWMSRSTCAQRSLLNFASKSFIQRPPHITLLVISLELGACIGNGFMQHPAGRVDLAGMIVFILRRMPLSRGFVGYMSLA